MGLALLAVNSMGDKAKTTADEQKSREEINKFQGTSTPLQLFVAAVVVYSASSPQAQYTNDDAPLRDIPYYYVYNVCKLQLQRTGPSWSNLLSTFNK